MDAVSQNDVIEVHVERIRNDTVAAVVTVQPLPVELSCPQFWKLSTYEITSNESSLFEKLLRQKLLSLKLLLLVMILFNLILITILSSNANITINMIHVTASWI